MFSWVVESNSNSPNRVYALHLPPLFRSENGRLGISRELNPERVVVRVQAPSRHSVQNNQSQHQSEDRSRNQNANNRGFSVNRRARRIQSRQSGQGRQQNIRSQSIPTHFRVQHHRNLIPNPRNIHQISPQSLLNALLELRNSQISFRQNNRMGPVRVEADQTSLRREEIEMLPKTSYSGKEVECSICLDNIVIGDEVIYLVCFHFFHEDCCTKWLQKSVLCPVCKTNVREHLHHQQG